MRIPTLPAAAALDGTEIVPLSQAGVTKRSTVGDLAAAVFPASGIGDVGYLIATGDPASVDPAVTNQNVTAILGANFYADELSPIPAWLDFDPVAKTIFVRENGIYAMLLYIESSVAVAGGAEIRIRPLVNEPPYTWNGGAFDPGYGSRDAVQTAHMTEGTRYLRDGDELRLLATNFGAALCTWGEFFIQRTGIAP